MRTSSLLQLGTLLALTAVGCRDNNTVTKVRGMGPGPADATAVTTIDTKAGNVTSNAPAVFDASFHDPPQGPRYEIDFGGVDAAGKKGWIASLWPTAEQVQAESAEIQLSPQQGVTGGGRVTSYDIPVAEPPDAGQVTASSGTVSITFGHGQLQGTVTAVPDELSGTFQAPLVLHCIVPRSMLDGEGGVVASDAGSLWIGMEDKDLVTPFCAALRHLITP